MSEPVSFSFSPTIVGTHAHVVVRAGVDGSRGLCGELTMRVADWYLLRWILDMTPDLPDVPDRRLVPYWALDDTHYQRHLPVDRTPIVVQPDRWAEITNARFDLAAERLRSSIEAAAPTPPSTGAESRDDR